MKSIKFVLIYLIIISFAFSFVSVSGFCTDTDDLSTIRLGVDVSSWNRDIDWSLAASEIDFAILRVGSKLTLDSYFDINAAGCAANGIPFGVYHVSSALTVEEAISEATMVVDNLKGYQLDFPVFFDVEYKLHNSLTSTQLQDVVKAFFDVISASGYQPGLFTYIDLMDQHFSGEDFDAIPKWVSQIDAEECTYRGEFMMWQYTWSGRVSGISGDVDCNYFYEGSNLQPCDHNDATYSYEDGLHIFKCSHCGHVTTQVSKDGEAFRFNTAAPTLSDDIVMNIAVTIPEGFTDPYLVVTFNGCTSTITDYSINEVNGRYVFAFPGINPQTMGDSFYATLYAQSDSIRVSVDLEYSMLKYINSQLKKNISDALRTALSNLVVYGEANQIYEGYKTDALLSDLLEPAAIMTPSTFSPLDESFDMQSIKGEADASIDPTSVTMVLGSKVAVRLTLFCADSAAYAVKVNLNDDEFIIPVSELNHASGFDDRYIVEFDQIRATQFGEVIKFTFLDAHGNQVGRSFAYSVYTYVQRNQTADNANLVNLLQALYNYGESVKMI